MPPAIRSSRDVIVRTDAWDAAQHFYGTVLGLPVLYRSDTMMGYETGAICLYVEKGEPHGPVFDFLVHDVAAARETLVAAGCVVVEEDPALPRCYLKDPHGIVFNLGRVSSGR